MGKRRARRQFNDDFKRRVVAETYAAGTSVSVVARRHDINADLLFRWRDDPRYAFQEQSFLPVELSTVDEACT
ncbi:transposase [Hellea sp.]|nr:transposase [Hellea sp.]